MIFNVIRWPDAKGSWWFVTESENGYAPLMELHPKFRVGKDMEPTWNNQLWKAAELLVNEGIKALDNPHGSTGRMCNCNDCFCCAAKTIVSLAYTALSDKKAVAL